MSGLNDRESAYENKFANDEAFRFKVEARCCKLFGLWVAEEIGIKGVAAEEYAKKIVIANLDEPGFEDVKRAVRPDIDAADGVEISDHVLDTKLEECLKEAKAQLMDEESE